MNKWSDFDDDDIIFVEEKKAPPPKPKSAAKPLLRSSFNITDIPNQQKKATAKKLDEIFFKEETTTAAPNNPISRAASRVSKQKSNHQFVPRRQTPSTPNTFQQRAANNQHREIFTTTTGRVPFFATLHMPFAILSPEPLHTSRGVTRTRYEQLPKWKFYSAALATPSPNSGIKECQICLGEFEVDEQMNTLPCMHFFHAECIKTWLQDNAECPLCRVSVGK